MIEKIINVLILTFLVIIFYGATRDALAPEPYESYDLTSSYVIVHWFDSEAELALAVQDNTLAGKALCEYRPEVDVSFCDLWLVHPTDLQDEYAFDTIGHEAYHVFKGDFHE